MITIATTRIPVAFLLATLIVALLFFQLYRLTAPMDYVAPVKPIPFNFTRTILDSPPPEPKRIEKPEPLNVISVPGTTGKVAVEMPPVTKTGLEKNFQLPGGGSGTFIKEQIRPNTGTDHSEQPLVRINPLYPANAAASGIEGWVKLRFNVGVSGAVSEVVVIDSKPRGVFDKSAANAVTRWRYQPMVEDGIAVERRGLETLLRFELQ